MSGSSISFSNSSPDERIYCFERFNQKQLSIAINESGIGLSKAKILAQAIITKPQSRQRTKTDKNKKPVLYSAHELKDLIECYIPLGKNSQRVTKILQDKARLV